jgi:hypothetical protein
MSPENGEAMSNSFVLNWRYVAARALEAFRTFASPVRTVREVEVMLQDGKTAASEYVTSLSEASAELTWKLIFERILKPVFRKIWNWLKDLIAGA